MRILCLTALALLMAVPTALARSSYINDVVRVTLRTGPGYDHKLLSVVQSGDVVEVLEEGAEWSRVRAADGRQGWVLTRLLTDEEPNVLKLKRLQQELEALRRRSGPPDEESEALRTENLGLENALTAARFDLQAARQAYTTLERETADEVKALANAQKRIKAQAASLDECRRLAADQTTTREIRWFLAGSGVLLVGLLIGLGIRRRRRSNLY